MQLKTIKNNRFLSLSVVFFILILLCNTDISTTKKKNM